MVGGRGWLLVVVSRRGRWLLWLSIVVAVGHWSLSVIVVGRCRCRSVSVMVVMAGHTRDCGHHTTGCEHCTFHG